MAKIQNSYKFPVIPDRISEIPGNSRREFLGSAIPENSLTGRSKSAIFLCLTLWLTSHRGNSLTGTGIPGGLAFGTDCVKVVEDTPILSAAEM